MPSPERKPFYAGGFLYDAESRRVLLHLRDGKAPINPNKWSFFGGGSEGDETAEECLARELQEELGIKVDAADCKPLRDYLNERLQTWRYVFYVERFVPESEITLGEGADFRWVALEEVEELDLTTGTREDLRFFRANLGGG